MFATLINYRLNPIFKADFFNYWQEHRKNLLKLGVIEKSVLHRETPISFLSYTRWQSREDFESHILKPSGPLREWQVKIEDCCNDVRVLYRMDIVKDVPENG